MPGLQKTLLKYRWVLVTRGRILLTCWSRFTFQSSPKSEMRHKGGQMRGQRVGAKEGSQAGHTRPCLGRQQWEALSTGRGLSPRELRQGLVPARSWERSLLLPETEPLKETYLSWLSFCGAPCAQFWIVGKGCGSQVGLENRSDGHSNCGREDSALALG